jgi:dolichyl-phosphate-mannose-protein mannosyltransferase
MAVIKRFISILNRWEYTWLCLLVLLTLAMHFVIISNPGELLFDEQHYVNDARTIIEGGESIRLEHPSLGKIFVVYGIKIFGDKPLGWRFFPVIFGAASIVFFYFICRRLSMCRTSRLRVAMIVSTTGVYWLKASAWSPCSSLAMLLTDWSSVS